MVIMDAPVQQMAHAPVAQDAHVAQKTVTVQQMEPAPAVLAAPVHKLVIWECVTVQQMAHAPVAQDALADSNTL